MKTEQNLLQEQKRREIHTRMEENGMEIAIRIEDNRNYYENRGEQNLLQEQNRIGLTVGIDENRKERNRKSSTEREQNRMVRSVVLLQ